MTDQQTKTGDGAESALRQIAEALRFHGIVAVGDQFDIGEVVTTKINQMAELHERIAAVGKQLDEAGLGEAGSTSDGVAALDGVIVRYKQLEAERDTLANRVAELEAKADAGKAAADKKAKAVPVKRSAKARAIAPITLKKGEIAPNATAIMELISAAETVEIAFSDGKKEIAQLPAQRIHGDAWFQLGNAVKLRLDTLKVYGPNRDEQALSVHGYGLLLDGELVAYAPRIDRLVLAPGAIAELKDDIVFFT